MIAGAKEHVLGGTVMTTGPILSRETLRCVSNFVIYSWAVNTFSW